MFSLRIRHSALALFCVFISLLSTEAFAQSRLQVYVQASYRAQEGQRAVVIRPYISGGTGRLEVRWSNLSGGMVQVGDDLVIRDVRLDAHNRVLRVTVRDQDRRTESSDTRIFVDAHPHTADFVYNENEYREFNPDIAGLNWAELRLHWIRSGIAEGRMANVLFHVNEYFELYADLRQVIGGHRIALLDHYVRHGIHEGRVGRLQLSSRIYDSNFYRRYPELAGFDETTLRRHWLRHGIHEGRIASREFNATDYFRLYPQIHQVFNGNRAHAADHYIRYGVNEQLTGTILFHPSVYNYGEYRALNAELASFDERQLALHWEQHGLNEGRGSSFAFKVQNYFDRYSDLQRVFGPNFSELVKHYVEYGRHEGRDAR